MPDGTNSLSLVRLSDAALSKLPAGISVPSYDRARLTPGIVHIGLGNFHRAHQAWYLHRLMQSGDALDWAIIGAGVRPADAAQRDRLLAQDCLTSLIELDPGGMSVEICGPMIDFLPVEEDNASLIACMAQPNIRIVALTVTEGGYYTDPATGSFDANHPDIVHDAGNPDRPRTAFGAMIAALRLRRDAGLGPVTGLSCDNVQGNGATLRQTVVSLARILDAELAEWIDAECSFPDSMVDCIVPATGQTELDLVRSFGIIDLAPVTHENFRQWVIKDDFCAGRPPWEKSGAILTDDVDSFETMKIRILNGGHQIIAPAGDLLGLPTIADTMADERLRAFLRKVITTEVAPHVAPVPGMTPAAYLDLIEERFSNPRIQDTTRRVAFDGSSRQPGFILPSVRDGLSFGTPIEGLALVSAIWARYCLGHREDGSAIEANDPNWTELHPVAEAAKADPQAWLNMSHIYGSLGETGAFQISFAKWAGTLNAYGVRRSIEIYLGQN